MYQFQVNSSVPGPLCAGVGGKGVRGSVSLLITAIVPVGYVGEALEDNASIRALRA